LLEFHFPSDKNVARIQIVLADDHAVVREGLKTLIHGEKDMVVVGEAADGANLIRLTAELKPDIAVMDITMPGMSGASAALILKREHPAVKIVALTVHEDRSYVEQLLEAGAAGYVLKRAAAQDLIEALRVVANGGTYLDRNVTGMVVESLLGKRRSVQAEASGGCTERETAVAKLVAQGYTNKEIAAQLAVSVKTIETHKSRCMEKLRVRSRAELVRYALDKGWLRNAGA
jgi:DNA-binding NarL/FixJ family response regulator